MFTQFSVVLGILAGVIQLIGYGIYAKRMGEVNTGSWLIWAIGGGIDLVSYIAVTDGDWVVNFLPAVCAFAAVAVFVYGLAMKKFKMPDRTEWVFVGADSVITVIWFYTNAFLANLLYQVSNVASFYPMVRKMRSGTEKEDSLPWLVWTVAYATLTVAVLLRLHRWEELAYPVSHVAAHAYVFWLARSKERSAR